MRTYDEWCDDQDTQPLDFPTTPREVIQRDPLGPFFTEPLPFDAAETTTDEG